MGDTDGDDDGRSPDDDPPAGEDPSVVEDPSAGEDPSLGGDPVPETGEEPRIEDDGDGRVPEPSFECPECGDPLPEEARFCPGCATALDEDGETVDLSELDGDILEESETLLETDDAGLRRASGPVRTVAGLAVSIPLAPLVLFLVGSVVSLSLWSAALVFLAGWLGPAAVLARARVPAEAFGRSLYLIAVATLLVPVALRAGGFDAWGGTLAFSFDTVALVSFALAGAFIALGTFVTGQARKRVTGERRGFEEYREE
jgi:hypothetical protein